MPLILPSHTQSYSLWLKSKGYQTNTIRNYVFDVQLFLKISRDDLSLETVSSYLSKGSGQNNFSRRLASLAKFCQFAFDQSLTDQNLFSQAKKQQNQKPNITVDKLLTEFSAYLLRRGKSPITVKNYQSDLRQFINFCDHQQS